MSPYADIEARLAELQKWVIRGLVFMVTVAISGVFVAAWVVHNQNNHIETRANKTDQAIACFIKGSYDRSVRGLPANPYYREHPDQLADALADLQKQRTDAIKVFGACEQPLATRPGGTTQ